MKFKKLDYLILSNLVSKNFISPLLTVSCNKQVFWQQKLVLIKKWDCWQKVNNPALWLFFTLKIDNTLEIW